ncbi:nuclear transport factor 2 family protein [Raineya sp.]|jgi:hypothetical protein
MPWLVLLLLIAQNGFAQRSKEKMAVRHTIERLFEGMKKGDSAMVRSVFHTSARLHTTAFDKNGQATLQEESIEGFIKAIGTPHPEPYNERIESYHIQIDDNLASVWTEYSFFVGERFSHCGVNAFQLFREKEGVWKIIQVTDTRRKKPCKKQK